MLRKNRTKILAIAIFSVLILLAIIARIAYKSSFAVDTDLSKLDSENGAIISIDEKLYKIANKYDADGLNKLKTAIEALKEKEDYEALYAQVKQALLDIENSDNAKSITGKVEEDTSVEKTDTTQEDTANEKDTDVEKTEETKSTKDTTEEEKKDDTTIDTKEEPKKEPAAKAPVLKLGQQVNKNDYIYMDLNAGTIKFNGSTYSGYVYETVDGNTTTKAISGNHSSSNKYYIYQSSATNKAETGLVTVEGSEKMYIPTYDRIVGSGTVGSTGTAKTNIINNNSVENVINSWRSSVAATDRTSTPNYIEISGYGSNLIYNITIDNVWSTNLATSNTVNTGGLLVNGANNSTSKSTFTKSNFNIKFEGDNRFGQIFYSALKSDNNYLSFSSDNDGSIVVAEFSTSNRNNHFRSIIGGQDSNSAENSYGFVFNSGNIYAGALEIDNCSAIGGGGNGVGGITINGGTVTAVCATSGAALGGGIGWTSKGGDAYVTINAGSVYAYNYSGKEGSNRVAGVAIGGGSGYSSPGNNNTEVTINGGSVYAQSTGGVAIGGGNSARSNAGNAIVNINGGSITALSVADPDKGLKASSGIGGGTGATRGGNATLVVTNGTLNTMDIGGGYATQENAPIGSATITVQGGTTKGRFILNQGSFTMTDGIVNGNATDNGGAVQINNGTATISGGTIQNGDCENGGAIYMGDGHLDISGGTIQNNTAKLLGGAIDIVGGTINITGGNILNNTTKGNGGGAYLGGGTLTVNGGNITSNKAQSGGGIFLGSGQFNLNDGTIELNYATDGGGINVKSGSVSITGGEIKANKSGQSGGGLYLGGGSFNMSNGSITQNISVDGAGIYLIGTEIRLTGGLISQNNASKNGGGFYIGNHSSAYLSNGKINNNIAKYGGGFYQTQGKDASTVQLEGSCELYNNTANEGNGGAIYIDGGSTFKAIGGKVAYNNAVVSPNLSIKYLARTCPSGVGGGIYISNGTFSMYDGDTQGNAAIFGNTAGFAADDLFASGRDTTFDAIKVTQMQLDDEYIGSDSWFEDFPAGEAHLSLVEGNQTEIRSVGRYKNVSTEDAVVATTVLKRDCKDYICITMGKSIGSLLINIDDNNVQSDQNFLYRITSDDGNVRLYENVSIDSPCLVEALPSGDYTISLVPSWSWRYSDKVSGKILADGREDVFNSQDSIRVTIYSEQSTELKTRYTLTDNRWITFLWNKITKIGG